MYLVFKRVFDVALSLIGLFLMVPIFLIIAISIRFDSKGEIFFKGLRTGQYGKAFEILKFRTMYVNSQFGAGTTSANDPRITRVGGFLRRWKLDELPQVINVLKGEMSLVGPRPELKKYTDKYIGKELMILSVKPGITDFSSIHFVDLSSHIDDANPDASFEECFLPQKNQLRIKYVEQMSFVTDLQILLSTIRKVFFRGA